MNVEWERDLARRTLALLDDKTTVMAPHLLEEPTEGYSSPERFEEEQRLIFNRYPTFVGLSCDLPTPGSWKTVNLAGTPILVTRDEVGRVRALLNICQHRGVRVVSDAFGAGARRFTCPFHAWTYDIRGRLVGVPGAEGFAELRREDRGLIELPAEERYGMIFAAADPNSPFSLEEYLGGLTEHFVSYGFENWKPVAPVHEHRIHANWKVVWGTFCETYHFSHLHRSSVGDIVYSNTSTFESFGDHALMTVTLKSIDRLRETPEDQWQPVRDGHINLNYRVFPTLSLSIVFGDRLEIFTPLPGGNPSECIALHYAYRRELPTSESERNKVAEMVMFACRNVVDKEDFWVAELTEPGLSSPSVPKTLVFGQNEPVMQHVALALRRALGHP